MCLHVGYGGYVRAGFGTSIAYQSSGWFFKIGSNHLQGLLLPKYTSGQGVFLSLAKKLK
jgi:hypothetical protein